MIKNTEENVTEEYIAYHQYWIAKIYNGLGKQDNNTSPNPEDDEDYTRN